MELNELVEPASASAIDKVGYSHDKMIDLIVANPRIKQDDLAAHFGYTPGWVSRIVNSDAFKLRIAQRRAQLVDPLIVASLEERFQALALRGLEVMQEKIDQPASVVAFADAAKAAEIGAKALAIGGFGQKVAVDASVHIDLRGAIEEGQQRRAELRQRTVEATATEITELTFTIDTEFAPC